MNKDQSGSTASFNLEEFSKKSEAYYSEIQSQLVAAYKGKYAAIDYETKNFWIGETVSEALAKARAQFPTKLFYVIQVGSPATFTVQSVSKKGGFSGKLHGPQRVY